MNYGKTPWPPTTSGSMTNAAATNGGMTNASMAPMGNGSVGYGKFDWKLDRWQRVNGQIQTIACNNLVARQLLHIVHQQMAYASTVPNHRIAPGKPLHIPPSDPLAPIKLSSTFLLNPEQFDDEGVALALATQLAYEVAGGEDAVILHGKNAGPFLKGLDVVGLEAQEGLFEKDPPQVKQPILDSINDGIKKLLANKRYGPYGVIVSLDLYREAFAFRQSTLDAPIYQISPLLKENGFLPSPAAPGKTGVILNLGGGGIDLAVPYDVHLELDQEVGGNVILRVIEQFRLRKNFKEDVVTLE